MSRHTFKKQLAGILCLGVFSIPGCRCTSCCTPASQQMYNMIKEGHNSPHTGSQANQDKAPGSKRETGKVDQGGKLYITRTDVYYVRDGKILWQSGPAQRYQKLDKRYFVATGDYVFCVKEEGTVIWKRNLPNKGSCDIKEGKLYVATLRGETALNLGSGLNEP